MNLYNLLEYSDNYADSSGILCQFKRDEQNMTNSGSPGNVTTEHSASFNNKSSILGNPANNGVLKISRIVVPLKYLSNVIKSLEILLVNCKIHIELNCSKNCVMTSIAGTTTYKITNTKLYVRVVTLTSKGNVNLTKQLNEEFKRPVYWNGYKTKIETKAADYDLTRFYLAASFQGIPKFYILAF